MFVFCRCIKMIGFPFSPCTDVSKVLPLIPLDHACCNFLLAQLENSRDSLRLDTHITTLSPRADLTIRLKAIRSQECYHTSSKACECYTRRTLIATAMTEH